MSSGYGGDVSTLHPTDADRYFLRVSYPQVANIVDEGTGLNQSPIFIVKVPTMHGMRPIKTHVM